MRLAIFLDFTHILFSYGRTEFTQLPRGSQWYAQCDPFPAPRCWDDETIGFTARIETKFDPKLEANQLLPAALQKYPKHNARWTEIERGKASAAPCPDTLDGFSTAVYASP
jgi:hypothetical protein